MSSIAEHTTRTSCTTGRRRSDAGLARLLYPD